MIRANQAAARGVDSGGRKKDPKWNQKLALSAPKMHQNTPKWVSNFKKISGGPLMGWDPKQRGAKIKLCRGAIISRYGSSSYTQFQTGRDSVSLNIPKRAAYIDKPTGNRNRTVTGSEIFHLSAVNIESKTFGHGHMASVFAAISLCSVLSSVTCQRPYGSRHSRDRRCGTIGWYLCSLLCYCLVICFIQ